MSAEDEGELLKTICSTQSPAEGGLEHQLEARQALDELLRLQYEWLLRFAVLELGSCPAALDAVQDTLVEVSKSIRSFRGDAQLKTWIFRIAKRVISKARKRVLKEQKNFPLGADSDVAEQSHSSGAKLPDELLELEQRNAELLKVIRQLPEKQRLALMMHYFEDLSVRDAAQRLGCSESSLKTHLFRARKKLEQELRKVHV